MGTSIQGVFAEIKCQRILQAHLKTAQATAQTKVFKKACKADPKEKLN